jgi:GDP-4-dehydro-6-deoxy-D-mannose reductase
MLGDGAVAEWVLAALPEHCDIRSRDLEGHVRRIAPDAVLHLAGMTSVSASFRDPRLTFDVNFNGTWNLLDALRATGFTGRFLFVSSGDCYGAIPAERLPVSEDLPLRPRSPYAVSKVAAEALCYQWSQAGPFDVVIARSFNHIGPGQDNRFAVASFAEQIAEIAAGKAPGSIRTGDLSVTRDLTDVRDVVHAYFALLAHGKPGETYNVGSGREVRLADVVRTLIAISGEEIETIVDATRLRVSEQRRAVADVGKIAADTGWSATTPLDATLRDRLDDWKRRVIE